MKHLVLAICVLICLAASPVPGQARSYDDPRGFSIDVPAGYEAIPVGQKGEEAGAVVVADRSRPGTVAVVLYAVSSQVPKDFDSYMDELFSKMLADPEQLKVVGRDRVSRAPFTAIHEYTYRVKGAPHRGKLLMFSTGHASTAYLVSAPASHYPKDLATLVRVLESFRFRGGGGVGTGEAAWETYREQSQGAFTVEFPRGWKVKGEVVRPSPMTASPQFTAFAPDSSEYVTIMEPHPIFFALPNAALVAVGLGPGQWYEPMPGERLLVMPFLSPREFLTKVMIPGSGGIFARLQVTGDRPLSELSRLNGPLGGMEIATQGSVLELSIPGQDILGQAVVVTHGARDPNTGVGSWFAFVRAWIARQARASEAQTNFGRMVATFKLDPRWQAAEQRRVMAQSNILTQTQGEIEKIIASSYAYSDRVHSKAANDFGEAMLGIERVRDEHTGSEYTVSSASNHVWIKNDVLVGTHTADSPGVDFRLMTRVR